MSNKITTTDESAIERFGNAYQQILDMYVSDNVFRPGMTSPFIQENFAIATDAHAIVCFKKSLLDNAEVTERLSAPDALSVIPTEENTCIEFTTTEVRDQISSMRKFSAETYEIEKGKCPDCDGTGVVDFDFYDYKGSTHSIDGTCPTCDDDDEDWEIIKNKKTGKEVESFRELFKIDGAFLYAEYIEKMVKTAELLSVKNFRLVYKKNEAGLHKFIVGECTICIMPVYNAIDDDLIISLDKPSEKK